MPVNDGRLQALDAETGKPVWEARVSYTQNEQTLTIAPRIAKGKVIVGAGGRRSSDARLFCGLRRRNGTRSLEVLHRSRRPGEGL